MFNELLEEIKIKQPVIHFVEKLFKQNNSQEAIAFFEREENKQFIEKVNVKDCVEVIFPEEMLFTNVWKQDKNFVEPNNSKEKQILRDLIDMGYVIPCEDFLRPEIIFRTTFLLLQKGMLCIAAEFFCYRLFLYTRYARILG